METWPTLYKKTSGGSIQYWRVRVEEAQKMSSVVVFGNIVTEFGQRGTDKPQTTSDLITKGKNIDKKNETTPYQQAVLEAQAKWEGKVKKGYVEALTDARAGTTELPGIEPMFAHSFDKQGHKIKFPCLVQPKLDGIRCVAIKSSGEVKLYTRTRKPITSVPHIVTELETLMPDNSMLDGELYNHAFRDRFEHIVHLVRQETPCDGHEDVQYHAYDIPTDNSCGAGQQNHVRTADLTELFLKKPGGHKHCFNVDTFCISETEVSEYYSIFMSQDYEGIMLRNMAGLYVNKRSYDLIKMKEFVTDEYRIVGADEGSGKLQGHVGSFVCETKDGKRFNVKLKGELTNLKTLWDNPDRWQGKQMTVQYQALTGDKIPRFPIGIAIRSYE